MAVLLDDACSNEPFRKTLQYCTLIYFYPFPAHIKIALGRQQEQKYCWAVNKTLSSFLSSYSLSIATMEQPVSSSLGKQTREGYLK
jgi:hypothetical protein